MRNPTDTTLSARFISPADDWNGAPLLRRSFTLDHESTEIAEATLFLSAHGVVEAFLGGEKISPDLLTPGWSSYEWRMRYAEYDVREFLNERENVLGLSLGNGWWRGRLGWTGERALYGGEIAGLAELRIVFSDGSSQTITTSANSGWLAAGSGTTANDLYDGQAIDARLRPQRWLSPDFDASDWSAEFREVQISDSTLEPYVGPPVRAQEARAPQGVWRSPQGRLLVDFGQNLVGWVRLRVRGPEGHTITLRHAEVLEFGELGVRPLRSARATDTYILSGDADTFEPTFTFHGFRYVEVDGWFGADQDVLGALEAVVIHSDLRRIGHFSCSDPLLTRLHANVVWSMRGNIVDVPTDCPQRDERLGWTGDLSAFVATGAFLYDVEDFLRDWLRDLALEQEHGNVGVPAVVPDALKYIHIPDLPPLDTAALWSDAAVWVPWAVWEASGNPAVLRECFPSMLTHGRRVASLLSPTGVWDSSMQFGDWLDPDAPADQPWAAKADPGVVATACAFRTATFIRDTARILGQDSDADEFDTLMRRLRDGFHAQYVQDEAILSDCSTVYTLAIAFEILDDYERQWAGRRLAELVESSGFRVSTGFAGTPFIPHALSATGFTEHAYRLVTQTESPSWLYPVTMGATTIWERWDSMLPDGSINAGEMTSFNHYAFGAVADWLHRVVAGITPLEPGYRKVQIAPQPAGELTWAAASLDTPHGRLSVRWDRSGDRVRLQVDVPAGVGATLRLPSGEPEVLVPGHHDLVRALRDSA